ncbi:MAG: hypothetical protein ABW110_01450, partial [Steroidobacteraceae bacterium]
MDALINSIIPLIGSGGAASLIFVALAAGTVFALAMGVSSLVLNWLDPVRRRLGRVSGAPEQEELSAASIANRLRPLAALVTPKKGGDGRVQRLLTHAGYRASHAAPLFFGVKAALIILLPLSV